METNDTIKNITIREGDAHDLRHWSHESVDILRVRYSQSMTPLKKTGGPNTQTICETQTEHATIHMMSIIQGQYPFGFDIWWTGIESHNIIFNSVIF